jgi:hypothetical protein
MLDRVAVDAAEPPRIVLENPAICREADRVDRLLRQTLAPALAPGPGWIVTMRVNRAGPHGLKAEGDIADASGAPVAHRAITDSDHGGECSGLARAIGVWASLVLDAEVRKTSAVAMRQGETDAAPISGGGAGSASGAGPGAAAGAGAASNGDASAVPGMGAGGAAGSGDPPAATPRDPAGDERTDRDGSVHRDEGRTLELGAGVFLMTGAGGGALAGPTVFGVVEAGRGVFLRPALAYGQSVTSVPPTDAKGTTWMAIRFDGCLRVPGLYTRRHGMQLDLCGGTEVGFTSLTSGTSATSTLPYWDIGPSLDLRGELGSRLSAILRVVGGINVLRESYTDQSGNTQLVPLATGRIELALSWDLQ